MTLLNDGRVAILEKKYNAFNEVEETCRYAQATRIFPSKLIPKLKGGFLSNEFRQVLNNLRNNDFVILENFEYSRRGLVEKHVDAENHVTTTTYNAFGQEESLTTTKMIVKHAYDLRGLEIETTKSGDDKKVTVSRKFDHPLKKMTEMTDESLAKFKYEIDPTGEVESTWVEDEKQQWVRLSHIEYDAFSRRQAEVDALGQKIHHLYARKERSHSIVRSVDGVIDTIIANMKGEKIALQNGLGHTQSWQHAADGQVINHVDGLGHTSSINLNITGWHTSKTAKNSLKTKEKRNPIGQLLSTSFNLEGGNIVSSNELNVLGLAEVVSQPNGQQIFQRFHKSGKLLDKAQMVKTDSGEVIRKDVHLYNEAGSLLKSYVAVGRDILHEEDRDRDAFDQLIRFTDSANTIKIKTDYVLDHANQVLVEIDASGHKIRNIYNHLGQKRFQIDAMGAVIECKYNAAGKLISERHYHQALPVDQHSKLADKTSVADMLLMMNPSTQDAITCYTYDAMHRDQFKLNLVWNNETKSYEAIVKETQYDIASKPIRSTTYDQLLKIDNVDHIQKINLDEALLALKDQEKDRSTYYIRDENGQPRFTIDAIGVVTERRFDEMGKVVAEIIYATPIAMSGLMQLNKLTPETFASQVKKNPALDRSTITLRTPFGEPEYVIDPEGAIISYIYDKMRNKIKQCYFNQRVNINPSDTLKDIRSELVGWRPINGLDAITTFAYDEKNQLIKQTDALGRCDEFTRDAMGNIVKHIDKNGAVWQFEYDAANRKEKEIAPKVKIITSLKWDPDNPGKLLSCEEEEVAVEKRFTYDEMGRLIKTIEANNTAAPLESSIKYNECHTAYGASINGLETKVSLNAKQQKIASQDESGQWTLYALDNLGRQRYTILPEGQVIESIINTSGEVVAEINYANAINLTNNVEEYAKLGLSIDQIKKLIIKSDQDIHTEYVRNARGEVICKKTGVSNIQHQYNVFGECIRTTTIADASKNACTQHLAWFDRRGQLVAECDGGQTVKRIRRDIFNQLESEETWASHPSITLTADTTLEELDKSYVASNKDKKISYEHDLVGNLTKETRHHVEVGKICLIDNESFIDTSVVQTQKSYVYDAFGHCIQVTDENNESVFTYYNARGDKIAETGIAREAVLADGRIEKVAPLATFGVNAKGQVVKATQHSEGVQEAKIAEFPQIKSNSEHDQVVFHLHDNCYRAVGEVKDAITVEQPNGEAIVTSEVLDAAGRVIAKKL
ncbi:MAG: RHS repeat domain-containing protein, partial [Gammaproteobacteria bacterium]